MRKKNPEMTANLPGNPLPAEYEVIPKSGDNVERIAAQVNSPPLAGVEKICPPPPGSNPENTAIGEECNQITHRVLSVANYLWIVVLIAFIVLLVSSTLLVANTIRLSIFSRRREIEVMKLVGATNWFVRGPFMIEGLLCGLGGALAAVILLLLGRTLFMPLIHLTSASDVHAWPSAFVLIVLGAGLALGAAGPDPRSAVSSRSELLGRHRQRRRSRRGPVAGEEPRRRATSSPGRRYRSTGRASVTGAAGDLAVVATGKGRDGSCAFSAPPRRSDGARGPADPGGATRLRALRPAAVHDRGRVDLETSCRSRSTRRPRRTSTTRSP
jgi:hypothetical protein